MNLPPNSIHDSLRCEMAAEEPLHDDAHPTQGSHAKTLPIELRNFISQIQLPTPSLGMHTIHLGSVKVPGMERSLSFPNFAVPTVSLKRSDSNSSDEDEDRFARLPYSYRERTARHAFRDTLSGYSFAPSFPTAITTITHSLPFVKASVSEPSSPRITGITSLTGPVLVMGGFRGSILRDAATNKRVSSLSYRHPYSLAL